MAFTEEKDWKDHVHHINHNHKDDRLENLEWKDKNEHYRIHFKKIVCVNIETDEAVVFNSETDAATTLKIPIQEISRVILGERQHTHGYWFGKING